MVEPWLRANGRDFCSRLILGLEQYASPQLVRDVLAAGRCDVFITTLDLSNRRPSLLLTDLAEEIELSNYTWIGTTSFARSRTEAVKTARTLREEFEIDVIKLDVRSPDNTPDNSQTARAAEELVDDGFAVMPFLSPDVSVAVDMADAGCAAVRVQASPVGSGYGICDDVTIRETIDAVDVPVIIEGGLGRPSHAAAAMELGAAAVLVNTAVAVSPNPALMAESMRHAVVAGRSAYVVGSSDPTLAEY